jgi:hypothetical protein
VEQKPVVKVDRWAAFSATAQSVIAKDILNLEDDAFQKLLTIHCLDATSSTRQISQYGINSSVVVVTGRYEDSWDVAEYKAILKHLSEKSPNPLTRGHVFLMVRTGRNRTRPTEESKIQVDTPDHPTQDTAVARRAAIDLPVLMLLRQSGSGEQGWRDCPFWWPVVVPPLATRTTLFAHAR